VSAMRHSELHWLSDLGRGVFHILVIQQRGWEPGTTSVYRWGREGCTGRVVMHRMMGVMYRGTRRRMGSAHWEGRSMAVRGRSFDIVATLVGRVVRILLSWTTRVARKVCRRVRLILRKRVRVGTMAVYRNRSHLFRTSI